MSHTVYTPAPIEKAPTLVGEITSKSSPVIVVTPDFHLVAQGHPLSITNECLNLQRPFEVYQARRLIAETTVEGVNGLRVTGEITKDQMTLKAGSILLYKDKEWYGASPYDLMNLQSLWRVSSGQTDRYLAVSATAALDDQESSINRWNDFPEAIAQRRDIYTLKHEIA